MIWTSWDLFIGLFTRRQPASDSPTWRTSQNWFYSCSSKISPMIEIRLLFLWWGRGEILAQRKVLPSVSSAWTCHSVLIILILMKWHPARLKTQCTWWGRHVFDLVNPKAEFPACPRLTSYMQKSCYFGWVWTPNYLRLVYNLHLNETRVISCAGKMHSF